MSTKITFKRRIILSLFQNFDNDQCAWSGLVCTPSIDTEAFKIPLPINETFGETLSPF